MQFRIVKKKIPNSPDKIDKTGEEAESEKKTIRKEKPQEKEKAENNQPTGSSDVEVPHTRTFSINQALNGKKSRSDDREKKPPKESKDDDSAEENYGDYEFSAEELISAWKDFTETVKDRPRLFHLFSSRTPEIKEKEVVLIHLDNPLQKDIIENILPQLLSSLRKKLNNSNISIETKVIHTETEESDNGKLYTMEDKFNYLVQKNPALQKLKRNMDLDFDY